MIRNSLKLTKLNQSRQQTLNYLKLGRPLYQTGTRAFTTNYNLFNETKEAKTYDFKTETHQLLDIVANSLYSEKEVFVRELVSNAADALEKIRHQQLVDPSNCSQDSDKPLEINIKLNAEEKTFIIQDNGIGMTEAQLHENLGTIARSGSKQFVKKLNEGGSSSSEAKDKIIGQFGVGFYSAFMVGHTLKVYTKSCIPGSKGYVWTSTGKGAYDIAEAEGVEIGTKIVIELKDLEFSNDLKIKEIIQKYSNFVGFPIKLNDEVVNTVEPIWTKSANEITEADHKSFFNQLTNTYSSPLYNLIYKADAPLSIRSVLYIPETSPEWLGMSTSQTGINLYSRKVMIQAKSPHLLPNWLRFISGVVDSEDIPLNLSREILQNGALIQKLKSVLTNRVVKWLIEEERKNPEKFEKFYTQFHMYIKEGVVTDDSNKNNLMKLLRFNSSAFERSKKTTFQSYLDRKKPEQKSIYYLCRTFDNVEDNPYYEPFKAAGVEVMVLTEPIDEMLIQQLETFKDTPLVNIESKKATEEIQELSPTQLSGDRLNEEEAQSLADWLRTELGTKLALKNIQISKRQSSHPALVVDHDAQNSLYFQQLMKQSLPAGESLPLSPVTLEINTSHSLIKGLNELKQTNPIIAKDLAYQICANARLAAGVMEDAKPLLSGLNNLLTNLVQLKLEGNLEKKE